MANCHCIKTSLFCVILSSFALFFGCALRSTVPPGETFDAGAVFAHNTPRITHRFQVKNTTDRTVRILGETHSCNCADIKLDKAVLAPGESTSLVMSVSVSESYSSLDISCFIKTDHTKYREWIYDVKLMSYPRARIVPDRIDLGDLWIGGPEAEKADRADRPVPEVWVEYYRGKHDGSLHPREVVPKPDVLIAEIDPHAVVEMLDGTIRRDRHRLTLRVDRARAVPGEFTDSIHVLVNHGFSLASTVHWNCVGPYTIDPPQIHLGVIASREGPGSREFTIRAGDGKPFALSSWNSAPEDPGLRISRSGGGELPSGPAVTHTLTLTYSAPAEIRSTAAAGDLQIMTDRPGSTSVHVPWSVFFKRQCDVEGQGSASHD